MGVIQHYGPIDYRTEQQRVCEDVKAFLKEKKITYKTLAKSLKTTPQSLSYYFSGNKFIPENIAKGLSELYGMDEFYLLHGSSEYIMDDRGQEASIHHELLRPEFNNSVPLEDEDKNETIESIIDNLQKMLKEVQDRQKIINERAEGVNKYITALRAHSKAIEDTILYISNELYRLQATKL